MPATADPYGRAARAVGLAVAAILTGAIGALSWDDPLVGAGTVALLAASAIVLLSRRDPATLATIAIALMFGLNQKWVLPGMGGVGTPAVAVGLIGGAWWMIGRIAPAIGFDRGHQPVRRAIVVFGGLLAASYATGMAHPITDAAVRGADRALLRILFMCGIALVLTDGIDTRDRLDAVGRRLVLATGAVSVIGIVQFFSSVDPSGYMTLPGLQLTGEYVGVKQRAGFPRVSGTALHPIEFAVVLLTVLPIALHYALEGSERKTRVQAWVCVGLIAAAVPMTLSRTGVVAAGVVGLIMFIGWSWRRRLVAVLIVTIMLTMVSVSIHGLHPRRRRPLHPRWPRSEHRGSDERLRPVFETIRAHPLLGIGLGRFSPQDFFILDNEYLGKLVESGILGVLAMTAAFGVAFVTARRMWRRGHDHVARHLGLSLMAAVAVPAVSAALFDMFSFMLATGVAFVVIGLVGAAYRVSGSDVRVVDA